MDPVAVDFHQTRSGEGTIGVFAQFRDKDEIKKIPGHIWKHNENLWTVPLSWASLVQLRGVFGDRLQIGESLNQLAWEVYEYRVKPCMELREAADAPWINEPKLTPLQKVGSAFMATAGRAANCDPMGSGKTPMTIVAMKTLHEQGKDIFPAVVICGNGAKYHWRNEFATWWPGIKVSVVTGGIAARRKALAEPADVYVINWEGLKGHSRLAGYGSIRLTDKQKEPKELNAMPFRTAVVDEIHRAKDPKAQQTRAAFAVCDNCEYIFALTGSLISNTPVDLWSPMRIVAKDEYPTRGAFIDRYALLSWNAFGFMDIVGLRGDTREELFKFLDPRFIRRPKEIILPELEGKLPPIRRIVDLAPKQRKAYNSLKKEMLVQLEGGTLMASNPMTRMLRLRQLAGATGVIEQDEKTGKDIVTLKDPSTKIDELVDIVEELGPDESIAVYSESKQLVKLAVDRLDKAGVAVVEYTGDIEPDTRERNRELFQEGTARVIILTYSAGSESIDLSRADTLVRLEFSWSAIKNSQAEERPVRPGRVGPLRIIDIVSFDTVDFDVIDTYGEKMDMFESVMRDEDTLRRWLS